MPNEDDQNHLLSEFAACGEKSRRKKAFRDSSLKVKGLNQGFPKRCTLEAMQFAGPQPPITQRREG